jgi:Ala-tRNA(Pro) deacylase
MSIAARLKSYLDKNKVSYARLTHPPTYTAQAAAATLHVPGKEMAKTVVVCAGAQTVLAVVPASYHVDLKRMSEILGAPARLATEQEFYQLFPDCETGAMPPFGSLYGLPVYVDPALAADEEIVFQAGTHRDALRMHYEDFARLASPQVAEIAVKG